MDIISAYREAGTFRRAAVISGATHKTVKRVIARHEAGGGGPDRGPRGHNYEGVAALVAERAGKTAGRILAKRRRGAAGYAGTDRNFRRLVAVARQARRREPHRGRRPAVWLAELNTLRAAHGDDAFAAALDRTVAFCRWRAADVRTILAAGNGTADPRPAGDALILDLPVVPVRPLADYAIRALS